MLPEPKCICGHSDWCECFRSRGNEATSETLKLEDYSRVVTLQLPPMPLEEEMRSVGEQAARFTVNLLKGCGAMKTTEEHFKIFESECRRLQELWGLGSGWELNIRHSSEVAEDDLCDEQANMGMRRITVRLNTEWGDAEPTSEALLDSARHEMVHAILEPLASLSYFRCVPKTELEQAHHEVLNRLMRVLPK